MWFLKVLTAGFSMLLKRRFWRTLENSTRTNQSKSIFAEKHRNISQNFAWIIQLFLILGTQQTFICQIVFWFMSNYRFFNDCHISIFSSNSCLKYQHLFFDYRKFSWFIVFRLDKLDLLNAGQLHFTGSFWLELNFPGKFGRNSLFYRIFPSTTEKSKNYSVVDPSHADNLTKVQSWCWDLHENLTLFLFWNLNYFVSLKGKAAV